MPKIITSNATSSGGSNTVTQINADWNATEGVSAILNKPTTMPPTAHNHTASNVTDFDVEVSNNSTVVANTNARHTHTNKSVLDATTASYTTAEKTKLGAIESNAEVNNISDTNATDLTDGGDTTLHYHSADRDRANHTGTQTASTISNFAPTVRGTVLSGLSVATNAVITATDTILGALGKLQKQITDNLATLTNHTGDISNPHSVTKEQVGLGNVDNTSDLDKPISNATQTALNGKSNTNHNHSTLPQVVTFGNGATFTINQNSGTWKQKIETADTTDLSVHRLTLTEDQGTGTYVELFGVDGNGNIYGKGERLAKVSELPTKTSDITNDSGFTTKSYVDTEVQSIKTALDEDSDGSIIDTIADIKTQWTNSDNSLKTLIENKSDKTHTHTKSDITDFPTSMVANGGHADTATSATTATKLATPITINGVTFDGSINIVVADSTKEPSFSKNSAFNKNFEGTTSNIKMNGTGSVGSLSTVARADHVHPSDSSKANVSHTHTKANITDFPSSLPANGGNADTVDGKHANDFVPLGDGKYIDGGLYLDTHPENGKVILPFINNDIAFLLKRGGSATIKKNGVVLSTDLSNVFDGTPSYWAVGSYVNTDVIEIELELHKAFTWTNTVGISFGASGWRAKDIIIQVMRSGVDTEWITKSTVTNHGYGQHVATFSHLSGTGFDRVKFTMTNLNSSIFRIAQIFILNYGSNGLKETYMSRGGCDGVYGDILPFTDKIYSLGSTNKQWETVYANSFISNGKPVVLDNDSRLTDARTPTEHNHDTLYEPINANIQLHIASNANPHGVTKSQVGLDSVSNYGLATQLEAETGTSSAKYMTPLRVKQAIDKFKPTKMSELTNDAGLAGLYSPSFTGTPTAPTPTTGDNTTKLATTAFVQATVNAIGAGDMAKSVYDTNNDGIVDFAENLMIHSTYKSGLDANGIYTTVEHKRPDGTLLLKSVLSGGTSPKYTTRTETKYALNGTTVEWTKVYTISYDVNGNVLSEVLN